MLSGPPTTGSARPVPVDPSLCGLSTAAKRIEGPAADESPELSRSGEPAREGVADGPGERDGPRVRNSSRMAFMAVLFWRAGAGREGELDPAGAAAAAGAGAALSSSEGGSMRSERKRDRSALGERERGAVMGSGDAVRTGEAVKPGWGDRPRAGVAAGVCLALSPSRRAAGFEPDTCSSPRMLLRDEDRCALASSASRSSAG